MEVQVDKNSRLYRIIMKLLKEQEMINKADKGAIEINYSGTSETIQIKVVIQ